MDSDSVFNNGGVQYVIDKDLLKNTGDITIDFVNEGWQTGFSISTEKPISGSCATGNTCAGSCS